VAEETSSVEASPRRRRIELAAGILCLLVFLGASLWTFPPAARPTSEGALAPAAEGAGMVTSPFVAHLGIILAAGLTLIMYSFLYRDNALFKVAENLYVGVGLGYGAVMTWYLSLKPEIVDPLFRAASGEEFWREFRLRAIPILLGFMLVTRISRRFSWPSRYSYALMIGWGAGLGIPITVHSFVLKQLGAAMQPLGLAAVGEAWRESGLFSADFMLSLGTPLGGLVILLGTVSVLYYFFFSLERGKVGAVVGEVGIFFLMVSFGASFGMTVMGRVTLFVARAEFLLYQWLGMSP
jgi:hypothetical protein